MFYSQTFLARKGPLSTVWIAAHLQHRLKKSHYTSTDIPSTVQHIMDPGVPIALRMSGHLLLGVVRIYSKKVDYLFHDCNVVLTGLSKAFASMQLTLPEDLRRAPVQSITLPESFDLDAVRFDDEPYHTGTEDIHLRSQEEITLTDRIPIAMDHYVAISFDEDTNDSSHTEVLPDSGVGPMEEDIIPQSPLTNVGFQDVAGLSIQREIPTTQPSAGDHPHNVQDPEATHDFSPGDNTHSQETEPMPMENIRDASNDCNLENPPVYPNLEDKDTEPIRDLDNAMNEKDIPEETERISPSPQQHFGPSTPATSQGAASDSQVFRGHSSPNLVFRESPPVQQPQRRGRKRKQFFDDPIVLANKFMRGALNNPSDILRTRKDVPSSTLDTWRLNNSRRKEQIFDEPLLSGFCKDLLDISKREYICSKPHLVISEEDHEDAGIAGTPSPTNQIHEEPRPVTPSVTSPAVDMEIEGFRNFEPSPGPTIPAHSVDNENNVGEHGSTLVVRDDDSIPEFRSLSRERTNATIGQTPDSETSPAAHESMIETPTTYQDTTFQKLGLSDTYRLINSAATATTDELSFLEADNNSPASWQSTSGGINLSERTRSVAEYLKKPFTPIIEDQTEDLSLNKILEGKTRRISARMFFEVLVLKSHGLVDVQQDEPYGDVSLKLTPALKSQI